jgi:hypothetical protein
VKSDFDHFFVFLSKDTQEYCVFFPVFGQNKYCLIASKMLGLKQFEGKNLHHQQHHTLPSKQTDEFVSHRHCFQGH